jgi:pyridoxal phosphate enzyme (YggS family)
MTFAALKDQIDTAARKTGRRGNDITVVAVSKGRDVKDMLKLSADGADIFGESRLQEALPKIPLFSKQKFHFIGRLQSNKIKQIVANFDFIQSVDSLDIARRIDKAADEFGKVQKILIQINPAGEKQKGGVAKEYLSAFYENVVKFPHISVLGFMMIPPYNGEENRSLFGQMYKIYESYGLRFLSMGMSGDFTVAVEEGANMVRVGSALFETP